MFLKCIFSFEQVRKVPFTIPPLSVSLEMILSFLWSPRIQSVNSRNLAFIHSASWRMVSLCISQLWSSCAEYCFITNSRIIGVFKKMSRNNSHIQSVRFLYIQLYLSFKVSISFWKMLISLTKFICNEAKVMHVSTFEIFSS